MSPDERKQASDYALRMIASMNNGLMGCAIADPTPEDHDRADADKDSSGY
jgi:hypothetical protein